MNTPEFYNREVETAAGSIWITDEELHIIVHPYETQEIDDICEFLSVDPDALHMNGAEEARVMRVYYNRLLSRANAIFTPLGGNCQIDDYVLVVFNLDMQRFFEKFPTEESLKHLVNYLADPSEYPLGGIQ